MINDNRSTESLKLQFRSVLESVFAAAPRESCRLIFREEANDVADAVATFEPFGHDCARINAMLRCNYGVYLNIGKAAVFEIPLTGKRYTEYPFAEELKLLCTGVISDGFSEVVVTVNGETVGANGRIIIPGIVKVASDGWLKLGKALFRRKIRTQYSYLPYYEEPVRKDLNKH
jgi:hypothetical protein